ncbi:MAG: cysteine desulfurase family protein [Pirellulaceae bacterium]
MSRPLGGQPPPMLYLDHNSTAPTAPGCLERMRSIAIEFPGNPASQHGLGRAARKQLDEAADTVLNSLSASAAAAEAYRVVWTSGGTEANNLALFGATRKRPGAIVVTAIEHASIRDAAMELQRLGHTVLWLPVGSDGVCQLEPLEEWVATRQPIALVSMMLGNNETGVLQPVGKASRICRDAGVLFHCDAVQAIGKHRWDLEGIPADFLTINAHKIGGPVGVGALVMRRSLVIQPQLFGGSQQLESRPGTESLPLAAGMAYALSNAQRHLNWRITHLASLRDLWERRLREALPGAVVIGDRSPRLPQTSCIAFPGWNRQALQMALDLQGLACSTGSACASGSSQPSHVLAAMGLPGDWQMGALRFSWGPEHQEQDVDRAVAIVSRVVQGKSFR